MTFPNGDDTSIKHSHNPNDLIPTNHLDPFPRLDDQKVLVPFPGQQPPDEGQVSIQRFKTRIKKISYKSDQKASMA